MAWNPLANPKTTTDYHIIIFIKLLIIHFKMYFPMKKHFLKSLALACVLLMPSVMRAELQGSGTSDDPYLLGSFQDLQEFADLCNSRTSFKIEDCARLTADIDMNNTNWKPIGICGVSGDHMYAGTFDGDSHTIKNLYSHSDEGTGFGSIIGLFGWTEGWGVIKNLIIENVDLKGNQTGGVAARLGYQSRVENVAVIGTIKLAASEGIQGAIAGWGYSEATIKGCYTTHNILSSHFEGTVTNSYYQNAESLGRGTNMVESQFTSGELCYNLNGCSPEGVWKQDLSKASYPTFSGEKVYYNPTTNTYSNGSVGTGTEDDPYLIYSAQDLKDFAEKCNACTDFKIMYCATLMADIDLQNENWKPIGLCGVNGDHMYAGVFNGNQHTIKNLYCHTDEGTGFGTIAGLFGWTEGWGLIKNLIIENADIKGSQAAAIVGRQGYKCTVENVGVIGDITITSDGEEWKGAISAWGYSEATIKSCFTTYYTLSTNFEGTVTDSYYLNTEVVGVGAPMNESQFSNGELCYSLNHQTDAGIWKQTLKSDDCPNFSGSDVYYVEGGYSNSINGDGSEGDPFKIRTYEDLKAFADLCNEYTGFKIPYCAILMADIDMNNVNWKPIGITGVNGDHMYAGTFNGNYHTIKNLCCNVTEEPTFGTNAGLFANTEGWGVIKNLIIENAYVAGNQAGCVVARLGYQSRLENVAVIGTISAIGSEGIQGGLVGWAYREASIINSYTSHSVLSSNAEGTITNSYYLNKVAEGVGTPAITDQFISGEICYALNGSSAIGPWRQTLSEDEYPTFTGSKVYYVASDNSYNNMGVGSGTEDDPYLLYDKDDLKNFANRCNACTDFKIMYCARLEADIDLEKENWKPIGLCGVNGDHMYAGTFDGNYHTIKNLYCHTDEGTNFGTIAGLFGWTEGWGLIKNLIIENADIKGSQAAAIVGRQGYKCTVENVGVIGDITITSDGEEWKGAISAWGYSEATIKSCFTTYYTLSTNFEGIVTDGYYLNTEAVGRGTNMAESQFTSGELCFNLNGRMPEGIWKQSLGEDDYPSFSGKDVYYSAGSDSYSNSYMGGGTEEDPFLIYSLKDLQSFREMCSNCSDWKVPYYARLEADIDMNKVIWRPICIETSAESHQYAGVFDGNFHTIKNLYCDADSLPEGGTIVGLFGYCEGQANIKNLIIKNANLKGEQAGVFVGRLGYQASLDNVASVGDITITTPGDDWKGGLVAWGYSESYIQNSYTTYEVLSTHMEGNVDGAYYLNTEERGVGEAMTSEQFTNGELCFYLNNEDDAGLWKQTLKKDDYPTFTGGDIYYYENQYVNSINGTGSAEDPFKIRTADDLWDFAKVCNECTDFKIPYCAILLADIDLENKLWRPIGLCNHGDHMYAGTFDGNGHTIKNLYCHADEGDFSTIVGLFGYTEGWGIIKNLIIENADVQGAHVGPVVARLGYRSSLENVGVVGNITLDTSEGVIGGLVGWGYSESAMTNCYTMYKTLGYGMEGTITNCYYQSEEAVSLGTNMKTEQIASGELCYKLNGGYEGIWKQTLDKDAYPVFTGSVVYYDEYSGTYTNKGPDGIEAVENVELPAVIYNMYGQRVLNPEKGIYIIGGRKVLIK